MNKTDWKFILRGSISLTVFGLFFVSLFLLVDPYGDLVHILTFLQEWRLCIYIKNNIIIK